MEVRFLDADGAHPASVEDAFGREDGFVWVDVPTWGDDAGAVLERLGCHPLVVAGCRQRN
jgi:magnesium transporter